MMSRRSVVAVALFVLGFSFIESCVVAYLQKAFFQGTTNVFPLRLIDMRYLKIEIVREAATIIVLTAAALMLEKGKWRVFWMFSVLFAAWDILYYIWLHVLTGWPASLFDWDVLFLIPFPWLAPVLAPVLVALLLVLSGVLMLKGPRNAALGIYGVSSGVIGVGLIIWSFISDSFVILYKGTEALTGFTPQDFHWLVYTLGILFCIAPVVSKMFFEKGLAGA
ncbi:MAG TPA: hypothetical protein VFA55_07815 [Candidatus Kapabacteria bacterium]|nr:hypothetical protein [Candidatus Kapabacteria bacterium]